jgi:hypothetical protein
MQRSRGRGAGSLKQGDPTPPGPKRQARHPGHPCGPLPYHIADSRSPGFYLYPRYRDPGLGMTARLPEIEAEPSSPHEH